MDLLPSVLLIPDQQQKLIKGNLILDVNNYLGYLITLGLLIFLMHPVLLYPHLYSQIQQETTLHLKKILFLAQASLEIYERDEETCQHGAILFSRYIYFVFQTLSLVFQSTNVMTAWLEVRLWNFNSRPFQFANYRPWASQ